MKRHVWLVVCGLVLPICLFNSSRTIGGQTSSPPYEDPSLPIEKRVDDLVSRLSSPEKSRSRQVAGKSARVYRLHKH